MIQSERYEFVEGMVIATKVEPRVRLIINRCADSVFYCVRVGDRTGTEVQYLRDELQFVEKTNFPSVH